MPIQTQGHRVEVMPVYSPMDPSRVTFNPAGFTAGALSSIELMNELDKRRAFAAQLAEQEATRQGRIGAINAQNQNTIDVLPSRGLADIALANQKIQTIPGQTQIALGEQDAALADQALAKGLRDVTNETKTAIASAENTRASAASQMAGDEAQVAYDALQQKKEAAPLEHQYRLAKLTQDISTLDTDKNLSDQQKLATIRHLVAQSKLADANAQYLADGKPKANSVDEAVKELGAIQLQIQRLENGKVIDPNADNNNTPMPLIQYRANTFGPDGKPIAATPEKLFGLMGGNPILRNPEADRRTSELNSLYQKRNALTQLVSGTGTAQAAPVKSSSGAVNISSKAEFDALPSGSPFIFNGKQGIKK